MNAQQIAHFLHSKLYGRNVSIIRPSSLFSVQPGSLVFSNRYSDQVLEKLNHYENIVVLAVPEYLDKLNCTYIIVDNPRLSFARALQEFFVGKHQARIANTVVLGEDVSIGMNVAIGSYSVIGNNVIIGDNTEILNHVVIGDNTIIGSNCLIKSHSVIGEPGFGFDFDTESHPVRIPHIGNVYIGNYVEVGAFTTIARATLDTTKISDYVKIDDHVHIAHNSSIGENTLITACAEISGSVSIGCNTWVSPNCSITNNIEVGSNCFIGIGSVVTKDVPSNHVVAGNPARKIREQ